MLTAPLRWGTLLVVALVAGCGSGTTADLEPPDGWEGTTSRWWRADADTAVVFRDLSTFAAMGLEEEAVYATDTATARRTGVAQERLASAVRDELMPLFRNDPETVDSLFQRFVVPKLADADVPRGDASEVVDEYKRVGYKSLRSHFREPRVGGVSVTYPDSLREQGVAGRVTMQVRLDAEGVPQSVEVIEGVHPALDTNAMRALLGGEWRAAHVLRRGNWRPVPSWVRYSITFQPPA